MHRGSFDFFSEVGTWRYFFKNIKQIFEIFELEYFYKGNNKRFYIFKVNKTDKHYKSIRFKTTAVW